MRIALLSIARALLAGGEKDRARDVVEHAVAAAEEAEGGYQARPLAIGSTLMLELGDEARATELADRAADIARGDADLLISYRDWLVKKGYEWAASLTEDATTKGSFRKRRYESDKVLAQAAESLAAEDAKTARTLPREIADPVQRARALAAVVGRLSAPDPTGADEELQEIEDIAQGLSVERDRSYLLARAVEILAPLDAARALRLSASIDVADFKVAALADIGAALAARNESADEVRESAWQIAQGAPPQTAKLALALTRLGQQWTVVGDGRAGDAFTLAREAARGEPLAVERIEALVELAVTLPPSRRSQAQDILAEAETGVQRIEEPRGRGRSLARIAGAWMDLDPEQACRLLADLRLLGRPDFLDGVAQVAPGAARLGQITLVWQMFQALEEAHGFFRIQS